MAIDLATHWAADESLAGLVERFGGSVSGALLASKCRLFRTHGIDGVVGYRTAFGCAVALGDPVCAPSDRAALADAFRANCRARRLPVLYTVASDGFASWAGEHGYARVEFGAEIILDPRRDPQAGSRGRELRKKTTRAKREGVTVHEHDPRAPDAAMREREMTTVARGWRDARHGLQIYLAPVDLFCSRSVTRWFYALQAGRVVGVHSLLHLGARDGYLLDHLIALPDAPIGTTELLATQALSVLGSEGCSFATFGASPSAELGCIDGLAPIAARFARDVFRASGRTFHLDARARYRQKFQVDRTEPAFLLFDPPRIGVRQLGAILRAFNLSVT